MTRPTGEASTSVHDPVAEGGERNSIQSKGSLPITGFSGTTAGFSKAVGSGTEPETSIGGSRNTQYAPKFYTKSSKYGDGGDGGGYGPFGGGNC